MEAIAEHECELTAYALSRLAAVPGLRLYGDTEPGRAAQRLGVITFNIDGLPHALVAAVLGTEFGIGVRNGCFCAHPYLMQLLGMTPAQVRQTRRRMAAGEVSTSRPVGRPTRRRISRCREKPGDQRAKAAGDRANLPATSRPARSARGGPAHHQT